MLTFFRYHTTLNYPIPDSFPKIFSIASGTAVSIHTSLATTNQISGKIRALREITSRIVSLDERENLSNDLGEMAEAYEEGWDIDSDEDDD